MFHLVFDSLQSLEEWLLPVSWFSLFSTIGRISEKDNFCENLFHSNLLLFLLLFRDIYIHIYIYILELGSNGILKTIKR